MGQIDWLGVIWAGIAAGAVFFLVFRGLISVLGKWSSSLWLVLMWIPALMLGHALARIGPEKLTAKPWLYVMQSAGLALAIVIPSLWLSHLKNDVPRRETIKESFAFLLAYLAMGAVFWLRG